MEARGRSQHVVGCGGLSWVPVGTIVETRGNCRRVSHGTSHGESHRGNFRGFPRHPMWEPAGTRAIPREHGNTREVAWHPAGSRRMPRGPMGGPAGCRCGIPGYAAGPAGARGNPWELPRVPTKKHTNVGHQTPSPLLEMQENSRFKYPSLYLTPGTSRAP